MARIGYLTGVYPQWSETFIAQEIALLRGAGVPLSVAAIWPGAVADPDVGYLCERPLAAPGGGGGTSTRRAPTLRRQLSVLRHRRKCDALEGFVDTQGITHLHAAFADLPGLLVATVARRLRIPYSVSVHAADVLCPKFDDEYLFAAAEFVVACNANVRNVLVARVPELEARVHLVHHGLKLAEWPLRQRPVVELPLKLLFVGRMVAKKNPTLAVDVVSELAEGATLTMVGDGPELASVKERVAQRVVGEQVRFPGVLSRQAVAAEMAKSDVLLVTSVEDAAGNAEGIPNVVVEAMATGVPVVALPFGGVDELVSERTGWLADAATAAALVKQIRDVVDQPERTAARVAAARQMIERDFDAEQLIHRRAALFA